MGAQSCLILCDPMDCSPPGSSVRRIFQARLLEWVAISSSRRSSRPRDRTHISCICCTGRQILYHCSTWEAPKLSAASLWRWLKRIIESSYAIFYSVDALWLLNWFHWGTNDIQRPVHANVYNWMSLDICKHLWRHHYNQGNRFIQHLAENAWIPLFIYFVGRALKLRSTLLTNSNCTIQYC